MHIRCTSNEVYYAIPKIQGQSVVCKRETKEKFITGTKYE